MRLRALAIAATTALGMTAMPHIAAAAGWGWTTGDLNLRTCPSVSCAKITVMPRGARVWIDGVSGGWYHLIYRGIAGFASGKYITTRYLAPPPMFHRPPPPTWGYWQKPWWDPRYGAWYDGRRWYYNGRWYDHPSGFYFGFGFRFGG
jgi:uncharacterized protein YraI